MFGCGSYDHRDVAMRMNGGVVKVLVLAEDSVSVLTNESLPITDQKPDVIAFVITRRNAVITNW